MISASDRENAVLLINEAIASGASCKKACWTVWIVNFNTSHVTVYLPQDADFINFFGFQYISCYGLSPLRLPYAFNKHISIHLMLRFIPDAEASTSKVRNFNTSHVTVYHRSSRSCSSYFEFQYISCYGLSTIRYTCRKEARKFQYISCYGLSS